MTLAFRFDSLTQTGGLMLDASGRLVDGDALLSAVEISLFTRRADSNDDAETSRQSGWWADAYAEIPIGSRLWKLARSKLTPPDLALGRAYCFEALDWMVVDRVIDSMTAEVSRIGIGVGGIRIVLVRGGDPIWSNIWQEVRFSAL